MPEPIERSAFSGLNTDSTGDRIGDQALNLKNVAPVSATNIRPRQGTTEVAAYTPSIGGRPTLVDAAPEDLENGILIVCMNNYYSNGGVLVHEIERLFRFRPSRTADLYSNVEGIQLASSFIGAFDDTAQAYDFILDEYVPFTPSTFSGETMAAVAFLRQGTFDETGWGEGFFTYSKGLAAYLTTETVMGVFTLRSHFYDVNAESEITDTRLDTTKILDSLSKFDFGIAPLGSDIVGCVIWRTEPGGDQKIVITRNRIWNNGSLVGQGTLTVALINTDLEIDPQVVICDMSPLSKTRQLGFIIGRRETTSESQVLVIEEQLDADVGGTATEFFETIVQREYLMADWATWTDRPDTALDVQQIPTLAQRYVNHIGLLLGNWETPTLHPRISNPRLAVVAGPAQVGTLQLFTTRAALNPLDVVNSHADDTSFEAHGMVVDQFGYMYAVGTGDFVSDDEDYLIIKYAPWDFSIRVAGVLHESNGLGDFYDDPLDTHICYPMIDGAYLIVQDIDDNGTRIFVYDLNLNFISKTVIGSGDTPLTQGAAAGNVATGDIDWVVTQVPGGGIANAVSTGLSTTSDLQITGFGFDVPLDATITGVLAQVNRQVDASATTDHVLQMIISGAATGDDKADTGTNWPGALATADYGGTGDTWGNALTPAIVNADDFGISISADMNVVTLPGLSEVESISITIYYDSAVQGPVVANKYSTRFFADNY